MWCRSSISLPRVPLSVSILLGELGPSGGVRAVLNHAGKLAARHGMDVRVVTWDEPPVDALPAGVEGVTLDHATEIEADVALATWWRTAYSLFDVPARRYAYFVQSLEERLYRPGDPERLGVVLTHGLPVSFLTEASWIAELLGRLRPDVPCRHVPNGIDKELFRIRDSPSASDGPLRVLVEGSPELWFKGVPDALKALDRMTEPRQTTLVTPERGAAELDGASTALRVHWRIPRCLPSTPTTTCWSSSPEWRASSLPRSRRSIRAPPASSGL